MVLAVTELLANPSIMLGCVNSMVVPIKPLRLEVVVPSNSVLENEDVSNVDISASMTRASKEVNTGGKMLYNIDTDHLQVKFR